MFDQQMDDRTFLMIKTESSLWQEMWTNHHEYISIINLNNNQLEFFFL